MPYTFFQWNPTRIRSWIWRIPLCTRLLLVGFIALYIASLPLPWLQDWASLSPSRAGLASMYRFNSYPFMHLGFFHLLFNILAITPLLERFESEFGTLPTLALFTGPFGLLPGGIYILIEGYVLRGDTAVMGASIWVFLLLCSEAYREYKQNPYFNLGPYKIPTWSTPLFLILIVSFLFSNVSLIGHLSGAAVGYLWGLGYIRFLVPPEKILRFLESKLNLLGRLPHYVSVDQKTYGRYGVLPTSAPPRTVPVEMRTPGQRLGP